MEKSSRDFMIEAAIRKERERSEMLDKYAEISKSIPETKKVQGRYILNNHQWEIREYILFCREITEEYSAEADQIPLYDEKLGKLYIASYDKESYCTFMLNSTSEISFEQFAGKCANICHRMYAEAISEATKKAKAQTDKIMTQLAILEYLREE